MESDFDRACEQVRRALLNGVSLADARIGAPPILSLAECRKLSRQTSLSVDELQSEFIGLEDGWEDFRQAVGDFKREISRPFLRIVDKIARWLSDG